MNEQLLIDKYCNGVTDYMLFNSLYNKACHYESYLRPEINDNLDEYDIVSLIDQFCNCADFSLSRIQDSLDNIFYNDISSMEFDNGSSISDNFNAISYEFAFKQMGEAKKLIECAIKHSAWHTDSENKLFYKLNSDRAEYILFTKYGKLVDGRFHLFIDGFLQYLNNELNIQGLSFDDCDWIKYKGNKIVAYSGYFDTNDYPEEINDEINIIKQGIKRINNEETS